MVHMLHTDATGKTVGAWLPPGSSILAGANPR